MAEHGKTYSTREEYLKRKQIFEEHVKEINFHNAQPNMTWKMAINKFTDMDENELHSTGY